MDKNNDHGDFSFGQLVIVAVVFAVLAFAGIAGMYVARVYLSDKLVKETEMFLEDLVRR